MRGIPPDLYRRIEDVLLKCGLFDNFNELKAVFSDARISLWHKEVRDAATAAARVQVNVDFLRRQSNTAHENGLVLLLRVLSDAQDETDMRRRELITVADALEAWLNSRPPPPLSKLPHRSGRIALGIMGGIALIAAVVAPRLFAPANPCPQAQHSAWEDFEATMVFITGTVFLMGDDELAPPQHEVSVASFKIDKYEVTNLQYKRFIDAEGYPPPKTWQGDTFPSGLAFVPVVGVWWQDALAYCTWVGKRLPTEAEWELACRGPQNNPYPWGDKPRTDLANVAEGQCGAPLAVGGYSPADETSYGVSDMAGNVGEWTNSIAGDYPYRKDDGREDTANLETMRVIRGGSFDIPLGKCAERSVGLPFAGKADVGFRCARNGEISP